MIMKKITILGACVLCGFSAFAQQSVLKEAERAMKDKATMKKVVEVVKPAFTNPETENNAQTYYIPGKAAFNEYDNLLGLKQFGKLPEDGQKTMGENLLEGYDYMIKSLSLDSVVNDKGKIKTKYSKDIISVLAGHYHDYNNNAIELWNIQDYKGAYKAWNIYLEMSAQPQRFKGIQVPNDTLLADIAYNQALAAWQMNDLKASLKCFLDAKQRGNDKKNVYDYAISVASQLGDTATVLKLANEAMPLYGEEDSQYIGHIINDYLLHKDFDNAIKYTQDAISKNPDNPQYYIILGVIYDNQSMRNEAKEAFKKALAVNSEDAKANYLYGRAIYLDAYDANDKGPSDINEIEAYFEANVKPLLQESATYLEKSYSLDPENSDTLKLLENVYYSLNDEAKLKDVQSRK